MQWIGVAIAIGLALLALWWAWPLLLAGGLAYYLWETIRVKRLEGKSRTRLIWLGVAAVLVATPIQIYWLSVRMDDSNDPVDSPTTQPSGGRISGDVTDLWVASSSEVMVSVKATNEGDAPATPSCSVTVSDSSGANWGLESWAQDAELQPGESVTFGGSITVTNNGAASVADSRVDC